VLANIYDNGNDQLELVLCCVGIKNLNETTGFPLTRQLAVDLRTSTPYPFTFQNRGPEISRRHAWRTLHGAQGVVNLIDEKTGELIIKSIDVAMPSSWKNFFEDKLRLARTNPKAFLQSYSTSPLHESEMFVPDMIGKLEFILKNQNCKLKELRYTFLDGTWVTC
jgi:hypothetical protein